jgi:CRISPR-associated protein (TIGR03984 family)
MRRQVKDLKYSIEPVILPPDIDQNFPAWLSQQFQGHNLRWLLAYADDGVIWGEMRQDGLHLSSEQFPEISPSLRYITFKEARLFSENAEIHLWKDGDKWQCILIRDGEGSEAKCYDESYLLWGTNKQKTADGFTVVYQGSEGLCHAPPVSIDDIYRFTIKIKVRHFLNCDSDGQAYIAFSRLVSLYCSRGE